MKYTLKKPITVGDKGQPVTELVFREEIVAGDLRGLKVSGLQDPAIDDLLKIAGRLCGQPDVVMNRLAFVDLPHVVEVVGGFLQAGQPTGSEPSAS